MEDQNSQASEISTPKSGATKDKNCPYCGQAFTSSSLGRHLDLYIREKNPKAPDGIHDVESIRKLRGNITRRQVRTSMGAPQREVSTPVRTPRPSVSAPVPQDTPTTKEPEQPPKSTLPKDGQYAVDSTLSKFPFASRWEATGVMNDIPPKSPWEAETPASDAGNSKSRPAPQRTASRQMMQKAQFDAKQKLADALDTARAAELALREFISSWRSAK